MIIIYKNLVFNMTSNIVAVVQCIVIKRSIKCEYSLNFN